MRTVAETAIFQRYADEVWSDAERNEFITWIATNPTAGDAYLEAVVAARFAGLVPAGANAAAPESSTSTHPTKPSGC